MSKLNSSIPRAQREEAFARAIAGAPVFPCAPGGKEPITRYGFLDATTDPHRLKALWEGQPDANVAMPTGEASGIVALDLDPENGARETMFSLPSLPPTLVIGTGGGHGGCQSWFKYPQESIKSNAGKLGPGIDIRADGGYVLIPPSTTVLQYAPITDYRLAPLPRWIIERCREPSFSGEGGSSEPVSISGPPIYKGQRNWTLYRIACKLRGQGYGYGVILATIEDVNLQRCIPPIGQHPDDDRPDELQTIAGSASSHSSGSNSPGPGEEVLEILDNLLADMLSRPYPGKAGLSKWKIKRALISVASEHAILIPGGVRVQVSHRELAERAATRRKTVTKHLLTMRQQGELRFDNLHRKGDQPGAIVLPRLDSCGGHSPPHPTLWSNGADLSQLRYAVAGVPRLGPGAGRVMEVLVAVLGGEGDKRELARALGMRTSNLTRRAGPLHRLYAAGIVERDGDVVRAAPEWEMPLEAARADGLEEEALEAQRAYHRLERAERAHQREGSELSQKRRDKAREDYQDKRIGAVLGREEKRR